MKIAIISDSHDNLATMEKFIAFSLKEKIKVIIHCGDIQSKETLEVLAEKTGVDIVLTFGNADDIGDLAKLATKLTNVKMFRSFGEAEIGGLKIGFSHYRDTAVRNCESRHFDFCFYGHSHKPWMETVNGCVLANPGTLAGLIYMATFAVLDTDTKKLDLKIVSRI